jgi:hypothetical protein
MKAWDDMAKDERVEFLKLATAVVDRVETGDLQDAVVAPALTAMFVKCWRRPVHNVWVEYTIGPELFIDDAIQGAVQFFANLTALLRTPEARERFTGAGHDPQEVLEVLESAAQRGATAEQVVQRPDYRRLVVAVFKEIFERAQAEEML